MTINLVLFVILSLFASPFSASSAKSVDTDVWREKVKISVVEVKGKPRGRVGSPSRPMPVPRVRDPKICSYSDSQARINLCPKPEATREANRTSLETEVLRASRTLGLPALKAHTQPAKNALINIPTILYTNATPFTRDVTLLGQTIRIEATPTRYTWHHGDGTRQTTHSPGAKHPSHDVTHTYQKPKKHAPVRVDTTYQIRYRTPDGQWTTLADTLTITGPTTNLTINEARPYLTTN